MTAPQPCPETPPTEFWGVEAELVPLRGGQRNQAFRTMGLTRDLVFKTTRRSEAAIEWLIPVFGLAAQCGFVVPWPVPSVAGRMIEQGWTCEPFIRGGSFRPEDMHRIGPLLSTFQETTKFIPQRPGFLAARDFLREDQGGDVDLRLMPANIVARCRAAWAAIAAWQLCVVHGDLNPSNLIWTEDDRVALLDWDECRVDATLFDGAGTGGAEPDEVTARARLAWEVACSWQCEPAYATECAAAFMRLTI